MEVEGRLEQIIDEEVAERMSEVEKEYLDQISDLKKMILEINKKQEDLTEENIWLKKKLADLNGEPGI